MTYVAYGLHIVCPKSSLVAPDKELALVRFELEVWNGAGIIIIVIGIFNEFKEKMRLGVVQVSRQPLLR